MCEEREMTLLEYARELPKHHLVNKELNKLQEAFGLLNSMIQSNEQHTEISLKVVTEVRGILYEKLEYKGD